MHKNKTNAAYSGYKYKGQSTIPAFNKIMNDTTMEENAKNMGWTLPGYKYLGPGNSTNLGEPTNKADAVAQKHDINYDYAVTSDDIKKADHEAVKGFLSLDTLTHAPVGGLVGAAGIEAKIIAENVVGVQYPKLPKEEKTRVKPKESNRMKSNRMTSRYKKIASRRASLMAAAMQKKKRYA